MRISFVSSCRAAGTSRAGPMLAVAVAVPIFLLSSCGFPRADVGPTHDEPISINLGSVERANVRLNLAAGELVLRGGADKLLQGRFEYNVARWKPEVNYSSSGGDADLTISQPKGGGGFGNSRNHWDLELNDKVALDFGLNCGAGETRLEMGDLDLRHIKINMGAGQVDLDLRGKPTHDYDAELSGGVGQATIRLPQNVGIRAEAHGGIGHIEVTGLENRGDHFQNSLYGNANVNVRLQVHGGIGEIRIIG
jgi:hypothetical protein